ncbi:hypothetical protein ACQRBF_07895 [Peptoniphilaceae bacterium SGI.131]
MNFKKIYDSKLVSLNYVYSLIKSNDTIACGLYACEPINFLENLHTIVDRVKNISVWSMIMMGRYPFLYDESLIGKIDIWSAFYGAHSRAGHWSGRHNFVPTNLHSIGDVTIATRRPNIFVVSVSEMDESGNVYLSCDLEATLEWLDAADMVIFEISKDMPIIYGDTAVPIYKADYIYESNRRNTPILPSEKLEKRDLKIAKYVSSLVEDGDVYSLG